MRSAQSFLFKFSSKPEALISSHPTVLYLKTNENSGPVQKLDQELLNVFPKTSLAQIHTNFLKHQSINKQNKLHIRDIHRRTLGLEQAYLRILRERLNQELTEKDLKDLEFLVPINFGLEVKDDQITRTEMIVEQIEAEDDQSSIFDNPRFLLFIMWISLGIPSIFLEA